MTNLEKALKNGFIDREPSISNKVYFFYEEDHCVLFDIGKKAPGVIKHHGFYPRGTKTFFQGGGSDAFWAIDEHGQCWSAGDAGGPVVDPVDAEELLGSVEAWETRNNIRGFLGMKLEMPPYALEALENGWDLPSNFNLALYDYKVESKADRVLKIPGFRECKWGDHRNGNEVSYFIKELDNRYVIFNFYRSDVIPGRIVKAGIYSDRGEENIWVIDENLQVWMQVGDNKSLCAQSKKFLLSQFSDFYIEKHNEIRGYLRMPKKLTNDEINFLNEGWLPPVDFNLQDYDLEGVKNA